MVDYPLLETEELVLCKFADPYIKEPVTLCELKDKDSCKNRNGKVYLSEFEEEVHTCKLVDGSIKKVIVCSEEDFLEKLNNSK